MPFSVAIQEGVHFLWSWKSHNARAWSTVQKPEMGNAILTCAGSGRVAVIGSAGELLQPCPLLWCKAETMGQHRCRPPLRWSMSEQMGAARCCFQLPAAAATMGLLRPPLPPFLLCRLLDWNPQAEKQTQNWWLQSLIMACHRNFFLRLGGDKGILNWEDRDRIPTYNANSNYSSQIVDSGYENNVENTSLHTVPTELRKPSRWYWNNVLVTFRIPESLNQSEPLYSGFHYHRFQYP